MLFTSAAQAMEIRQFDKMAVPDQSEYVGLLVQGAEQVLRDEGRADLADQVDHLFTATLPHDAHTIGMVECERNLALARDDDAQEARPSRPASLCRIPDYAESRVKDLHLALSWHTKMTKSIRHRGEALIGLLGRSTGHRQADSDLSFWR